MMPKSGNRFSDDSMLKLFDESQMTLDEIASRFRPKSSGSRRKEKAPGLDRDLELEAHVPSRFAAVSAPSVKRVLTAKNGRGSEKAGGD
jgi:hypothetical protein